MWPTVAELKRALGVTIQGDDALDDALTRALGAAIEQVGTDLGYSGVVVTDADTTPEATGYLTEPDPEADPPDEPETIEPNHSTAQAALLLATTVMKAPDAPFGVAAVFDAGGIYVARSNPNYTRLLVGSRNRFGVG